MKNRFLHTPEYIGQLKQIEALIAGGQHQTAVAALNQLAKTAPNDPRLFLLGARLAESSGNAVGVLQAAQKAHQLAPQWPVAAVYLAEVLVSRNEMKEALGLADSAVQMAVHQDTLDAEILKKAASVAQAAGDHPRALEWLRQALPLASEDPSIRYRMGLALGFGGEYSAAVDVFNEMLSETPGNPTLLRARLLAAAGAGQTALAIQDAQALLLLDPNDSETQFRLDVAQGKTPKAQPAAMVAREFDGRAATFDRQLVSQMQYRVPRDVAHMVNQWYPDKVVDILDLGCGTGLLGLYLGPVKGVIVGVDLSQAMITQAIRHGVYARFHQVNVLDALQNTPKNEYHLITALDVLNSIGELDSVIPDAHRILMPGGRFVFSCETGTDQDADFAIQPNYHYSHQRSYVQRLLKKAKFVNIELQDVTLRQEGGNPVPGFLVLAQKSPANSISSSLM